MILLTGATGNVGSLVRKKLNELNTIFRSTSRKDQINEKDKWSIVDFDDKKSIDSAMREIETVILITPADEAMFQHQANIVDVAVNNGVKKIVKLSGLGAGPDAPIRLPKLHYKIEEYIKSSGLDYVFVRPNLFMQAVIGGSMSSIKAEKKIYSPVGTGEISVIDAEDVANIIVKAALDSNICNTTFEVTGPEALSFGKIADIFSNQLGEKINFQEVSFESARNSMLEANMDEWLADAFIELYGIYEQNMGSSVIIKKYEEITNKTPSKFEEIAL